MLGQLKQFKSIIVQFKALEKEPAKKKKAWLMSQINYLSKSGFISREWSLFFRDLFLGKSDV